MRVSVDDYHSLLARAVSALNSPTAEARQELYERARTALKAEFGKLDSPDRVPGSGVARGGSPRSPTLAGLVSWRLSEG